MNAKTKIIVLRMKQLIYTGIFVALGILLIILLIAMFSPEKDASDTSPKDNNKEETTGGNEAAQSVTSSSIYIPGVYTTELVLNDQSVDVEVIVDHATITSLRLTNLSESVTTLYPLLEPAFDQLREQIYSTQSLDEITYSAESKYTTLVLLEAVRNSLEKASAESSAE